MKETRVEFRSSPQEKDLLLLAAQLKGVNLSAFLREAALKSANEVVQTNESLKLSSRDRDVFLEILDNPQEPNAELQKAMKKFKKWK